MKEDEAALARRKKLQLIAEGRNYIIGAVIIACFVWGVPHSTMFRVIGSAIAAIVLLNGLLMAFHSLKIENK
jgi:hypothetical protein